MGRGRFFSSLMVGALLLSVLPLAASAQPAVESPTGAVAAPGWAIEASIYHVFVDRFDDGDPSNNVDVDTALTFDDALKDWMGGDLAGVEARLGHIEALGFDTIWLGPVYEGKYFHGYHPADFLQVDPNFGTNAELKQLVEAVHDRGMRIVYDFVPNHTSDEHPWFQDVMEEVDGAPRCQDSEYYGYYKFNEDCSDYQSFFGISELPELDLMTPDRPAARYLLDEVVPFYLEEIGFDGFRIDHAKGPGSADSEGTDDNRLFLGALRELVDGMEGEKYLFGEIWSPRAQIATYAGTLDGALNFPLYDALASTLARNTSLASLDAAVRTDLEAYADGFVLTSFLDNHDVQRFVFQAGNDDAARERLKLAFTAQFTLPGSPVVYNGTDIGMGQTANTEAAGGGWVDRWYREPFPWPDADWAHSDSEGFVLQPWHEDVADQVTDLNALRDEQPALIHGTYETVHAAGDLMLFERSDGDDRLLTVINRGGERTLDLDQLYGAEIPDGVTLTALLGDGEVTSSDGSLDVGVAGVSGEVFAVAGDLPPAPGPDTGDDQDLPELVVLPGNFQSELGCSGDWQPFCEETALVYDTRSGLWANTFTIPAGSWEYKVALNGSWDVNYGVGAVPDGPNFALSLSEPTTITFFFDHRTGWVGNDHDNVLANVPGSLQSEVGCPGDWDPSCYRTWLQDIDGDGVYTYVSPALPTGGYEFKVAVGGGWNPDAGQITGNWDDNYGVGGAPDGPNLSATIGDEQRLAVHFRPSDEACPAAVETEVLGLDEAPGTPIEPCDGPPPPVEGDRDYAVVHYQRAAGDEDQWGLHLWGDVDQTEGTEWGTPLPFRGETDYGRFAWIKLAPGASDVGFIVYDGDTKDVDADRSFNPNATPEIWLKEGDPTVYTSRAAAQGYAEIRYQRPDGDYGDWDDPSAPWTAFWGLHLWGDALAEGVGTNWDTPRRPDGVDDFGAYWRVPISDPDGELNFIIHRGDDKDPGPDQQIIPSRQPVAWIVSGDEAIHETRGSALSLAVLHYHRPDGDYGDPTSPNYNDFWGLHVWDGAAAPTSWQEPVRPDRQDGFGLVFEVPLVPGASQLAYILHRGDTKDLPDDQFLDLINVGHEVWILSGVEEYLLPIPPVGGVAEANLGQQRAHFVSSDYIAWPFDTPADATYELHHAAEGGLEVVDGDIAGGGSVVLGYDPAGLPSAITSTDGFFHLADRDALTVPDDVDLDAWLTGQLAVSATSTDGRLLAATGLQLPGVLDERYATDADLGVVWSGGVPSLHLWAPTAKSVTLHTYATSTSEEPSASVPMTQDDGVWSATGQPGWDRAFYLYEVEVYVPSTGQVERNWVTDPYSFSLAMDSVRSQIVRLSDGDLKPSGWDGLAKPAFGGQEELTVYELHVRDFSATDATVPEEHRGRYTAFTLEGTDGIEHLEALADAGLSHLHLLPTFDIATVPENPADRVEPDITMPEDPASEVPQATLDPVRDLDAFNWGYDPYHFTTPEGSYATDPDGEQRIREYREMVASLSDLGLRMVKDVVYNHTHAAGQDDKSVLDRIVPGYYQRLSDTGVVETSTCCPNTATEHQMMDKLTIDSVLTWATEYKVDGFRFDLMGHHPKAQMERLRTELDALTLEEHGVDGSKIVLYGEGWNFGEVANNARFVQATQIEMAGTGIGTFNDRLRDAARGGNPFGGLQEQGFVTGLAVDPNGVHAVNADETRARVFADNVRIGMAGNLADYTFETADGTVRAGRELDYGGSPAGYTEVTTDNVIYVSKHDNETLFDAIQYKLPLERTLDERARVQNLGLSVVALSQGTPFFHAGSDLMRSKSLDRDSYNSGDWFNRIFWDRSFNNWGVGLPPAEKNIDNWPLMRELLRALPAPGQEQIDLTAAHFQELLQIRESTDLFNLVTLEEVQEQLAFHATGPDAPLGVIAMSLTGGTGEITDVLVVVNADIDEVTIDDPAIPTGDWELHPVQEASYDELVRASAVGDGAFTVPARTTAVFVQMEREPVPDRPGNRPPFAGEPGPPPHAGVPGRPPHAGPPPGPPERPGPRPGIGPGGPTWWQVPAFATSPGRGR